MISCSTDNAGQTYHHVITFLSTLEILQSAVAFPSPVSYDFYPHSSRAIGCFIVVFCFLKDSPKDATAKGISIEHNHALEKKVPEKTSECVDHRVMKREKKNSSQDLVQTMTKTDLRLYALWILLVLCCHKSTSRTRCKSILARVTDHQPN